MSGPTSTIREFLVKLGFQTDETALKKFKTGISQATRTVVTFAASVEAAALAVSIGVERFANNLEALYFASMRTGTAASSLRAFDRAAQSFGTSAGQATASAEGLARFIRNNPSAGAYINGFLGQVGESAYDSNGNLKDTVGLLTSMGKLFAHNTANGLQFQNTQLAGIFGIDEKTMLSIQNGDFQRKLEETRRYMKDSGLDDAAEGAHRFMESLRKLEDQLYVLGVRVVDVLQKKLGISLDTMTDWLVKNGQWLANQITDLVGRFLDDFNKILKWLGAHSHEITTLLKDAFSGVSTAYGIVKPALEWIFKQFVALDHATGGWSTKLLALTFVASKLGAFSLAGGLLKTVSAFWDLGKAIGLLAEGEGIVAGIAAGIVAISGPIAIIASAAAAIWALNKYAPNNALSQGWRAAKRTWFEETNPGAIKDIVQMLMDEGLTRSQAIGAASNIYQESSGNPNAQSFDKQGREHYGLMQLSPDRQKEFNDWSKKYADGVDMHSASASDQAAFLAWDLNNSKDPQIRRAWTLMQAHDSDTAFNADYNARIFSHLVERPGNDEIEENQRGRRAMNMQQTVTIHITGATDPKKTADEVVERMKKLDVQMTREFAPTVQ